MQCFQEKYIQFKAFRINVKRFSFQHLLILFIGVCGAEPQTILSILLISKLFGNKFCKCNSNYIHIHQTYFKFCLGKICIFEEKKNFRGCSGLGVAKF